MAKVKKDGEKVRRGFMGYSERFSKYGFHPELDKSGLMKVDKCNLGPGQYDHTIKHICSQKKSTSPWKRQMASMEFSKNLGFLNAHILEYRAFMATILGPGSQDVDEKLFHQAEVSPCKNQNFGKQIRFFGFEDVNPAPGTYTYSQVKHNFNNSKSTINRAQRFKDLGRPWSLAPNRYDIKDPGSLKALGEKVVSLRGPYDLFTGPRSDQNIFNKFSPPKRCTPDIFYVFPSDIDELLKNKENRKRGVFLKAERFLRKPTVRMMLMDPSTCYRDPEFPSPAQYNIKSHMIKHLPEAMYSFGMTGAYPRPGLNWKISPGPGRYHIKYHMKCTTVKGGTSVFKSKTHRSTYTAPEYNSF